MARVSLLKKSDTPEADIRLMTRNDFLVYKTVGQSKKRGFQKQGKYRSPDI